jgi:hypothetical protein
MNDQGLMTLRGPAPAEEDRYRDAATELWSKDSLQIDEDSTVSVGEGGAWVQAWVWVDDRQAGLEGDSGADEK